MKSFILLVLCIFSIESVNAYEKSFQSKESDWSVYKYSIDGVINPLPYWQRPMPSPYSILESSFYDNSFENCSISVKKIRRHKKIQTVEYKFDRNGLLSQWEMTALTFSNLQIKQNYKYEYDLITSNLISVEFVTQERDTEDYLLTYDYEDQGRMVTVYEDIGIDSVSDNKYIYYFDENWNLLEIETDLKADNVHDFSTHLIYNDNILSEIVYSDLKRNEVLYRILYTYMEEYTSYVVEYEYAGAVLLREVYRLNQYFKPEHVLSDYDMDNVEDVQITYSYNNDLVVKAELDTNRDQQAELIIDYKYNDGNLISKTTEDFDADGVPDEITRLKYKCPRKN